MKTLGIFLLCGASWLGAMAQNCPELTELKTTLHMKDRPFETVDVLEGIQMRFLSCAFSPQTQTIRFDFSFTSTNTKELDINVGGFLAVDMEGNAYTASSTQWYENQSGRLAKGIEQKVYGEFSNVPRMVRYFKLIKFDFSANGRNYVMQYKDVRIGYPAEPKPVVAAKPVISTVPATPITQNQTDRYDVLIKNGVNLYNAQKVREALSAFDEAFVIRKDTLSALYAGYAAYRLNDIDKTIKYYTLFLNSGGKNASIIATLSSLYVQQNEVQKAIDLLQKTASRIKDKSLTAQLIKIYSDNGQQEKAIDWLLAQIRSYPTIPDYPSWLGAIYFNTGDKSKSLKYFEQALEIDPDLSDALVRIGVWYYNDGAEQTKNGVTLESVRDRIEKAVNYFEKAHELAKNDCQTVQYLNLAYQAINSPKKVLCQDNGPTNKPQKVVQDILPSAPTTSAANIYEYRGRIIDKKTQTVPDGAIVYYEDLGKGENLGQAEVDAQTGVYTLRLPYGKRYGITAKAQGFMSSSVSLDLSRPGVKPILKNTDLYVAPVAVGSTINLNNIFFASGKSNLLPESYTELNRIADFLTENPGVAVELGGHTDNAGNPQQNVTLSQDRADAVRFYLIAKGVQTTRLRAKGYGATRPVATNTTDDGKSQNRRVEFVIVKN